MGDEWTMKSFKSGNSVALRVPSSVGIVPGEEWRLVEDGANYRLEKIGRQKRKFDIAKVWGIGKHLDLEPIAGEDRVFEHRPLSWGDADWTASTGKSEP